VVVEEDQPPATSKEEEVLRPLLLVKVADQSLALPVATALPRLRAMEEEILSEDTVMEYLRLEAAFGVNLEEEVEVWVKLLLLRQERAQLEQQQERAAALDWVLVWQLLETLALQTETVLVETGGTAT